MKSAAPAKTVDDYLASLPPDRRAAIAQVRDVLLANLDADYEEGIQYGMIGYYVPHRVFPDGYHCDPKQPLPFAALGSQKRHMALHLMCLYDGGGGGGGGAVTGPQAELARWFRQAWARSGKPLDMGKACIRFTSPDDLPLGVIAEAVRRVPAKAWVDYYRATRQASQPTKTKAKATKAKP